MKTKINKTNSRKEIIMITNKLMDSLSSLVTIIISENIEKLLTVIYNKMKETINKYIFGKT